MFAGFILCYDFGRLLVNRAGKKFYHGGKYMICHGGFIFPIASNIFTVYAYLKVITTTGGSHLGFGWVIQHRLCRVGFLYMTLKFCWGEMLDSHLEAGTLAMSSVGWWWLRIVISAISTPNTRPLHLGTPTGGLERCWQQSDWQSHPLSPFYAMLRTEETVFKSCTWFFLVHVCPLPCPMAWPHSRHKLLISEGLLQNLYITVWVFY